MIEDLRKAIDGPIDVDRSWTVRTVAALIADVDSIVLVSGGGFIAGTLRPTLISPQKIASECGWFARDRSGLALLRTFEAWARDKGATLVQLSTGPTGMDLTRLGYRRAEQAWVK